MGTIQGGAFDDHVSGSSEADYLLGGAGHDSLFGGEGDDHLFGESGNDLLDGGAGSDTFVFGMGDGHDTVMAGPGGWPVQPDRLKLGAGIGMADVDVSMQHGSLWLRIQGGSDSVYIDGYFYLPEQDRPVIYFDEGGQWDSAAVQRKLNGSPDNLYGTPDNDVLDGGLGHDTLFGAEGNDTLYGDTGNDLLEGGPGSDTYLFGRGDGHDTVMAAPGEQAGQPDRLVLGVGIGVADVSVGQQFGDLLLNVTGGHDSVRIANYFNLPEPERPAIQFAGGGLWDAPAVQRKLLWSDDHLHGTPWNDLLDGGLGMDTLFGAEGNDTLYGDAGNDLLDGGPGGDIYFFGRGDGQDTVFASFGMSLSETDLVVLGAGIGMADVDVSEQFGSLMLRLRGSQDSVRVESYFYMPEQDRPMIQFTDGARWDGDAVQRKLSWSDDQLFGTPGNDVLDGGLGMDTLFGANGDDTLYGDDGRDWLDGGPGSDTYLFGRGDGQDTILSEYGFEPGQADRLRLDTGIGITDVDVSEQFGSLLLKLRGGSDSVRVEGYFQLPEPERLVIQFADGSQWDGATVQRKLYRSDDNLYGTPGDDMLDGGLGMDALFGADGDDTLYGDDGRDWLDGGPGGDTYVFGRGDGQDTIMAGPAQEPGQSDRLLLGAGIGMADVDVVDQFGGLLLKLRGSSDSVQVEGYFYMPEHDRPVIQFADGSWWDAAAVQRKLYPSNENLYGTPGDDVLDGGLGMDSLFGAEGNDTLYGDTGRDWLDGGSGGDTYVFGRGDGQDTMVSSPGDGSFAPDRLLLGADIGMTDVELSEQFGDVLLTLRGSSDSMRLQHYLGMPELDRPVIQFADGSQWDGATVHRKLYRSDDNLYGTPGNDVLDGGLGWDMLIGHQGDDTLYGDEGRDWLEGGPGSDTYLFARGDGQDTVMAGYGPEPGESDRLVLGAGIGMSDVDVSEQFGSLVLSLRGTSDSVRMEGYFHMPEQARPVIQFTDGGQWDGAAVQRALNWTDDNLSGTPGDDMLAGGLGMDTLIGDEGNDTLHGDAGNDLLHGGAGADTYVIGLGDGQDTIVAWYGEGLDQADRLVLGAGIDMSTVEVSEHLSGVLLSMQGSTDSVFIDNYLYIPGQDRPVIEFAQGGGWDTEAMQRKLNGSNQALYGSPADDMLNGGQGQDFLFGGDGQDTLYGDGGNDQLEGGFGPDTYVFGRGDGHDTVRAGYGGASGESDRLLLGAGINMADVYISQQMGDALLSIRGGSEGESDSVRIADYFYQPEQDRPVIQFLDGGQWDHAAVQRKLEHSHVQMVGTPGDDVLDGGLGMDNLMGHEGNDTLFGDDGDDWLEGGPGSDTFLYGLGDGHDTILAGQLEGQFQPDQLKFGYGIHIEDVGVTFADDHVGVRLTLPGGAGSVTIPDLLMARLPDTAQLRDMPIPFAEGGEWDTADLLRKLYVSDDSLFIEGSDRTLDGGLGNDDLVGSDGDDMLLGDAGRDTLSGGLGRDTLAGGSGNDVYHLDNADDVVIESADSGFDEVYASVSYNMGKFIEYAELTGSDNIDITGNNQGIQIWGNAGSNVVTGGAGDDELSGNFGGFDTLRGGLGDDLYYVLNASDVVDELADEGHDEVKAMVSGFKLPDNVESLFLLSSHAVGHGNEADNGLFGNGAANQLLGMGGDDVIVSYGGHDTITGGKGDDLLSGGAGNDTYVYNPDDGYDAISNLDAKGTDTLLIHGATESQIWFKMYDKSLAVSIIGRDGEVTVGNWARSASYQIDSIRLDNGKVLTANKVTNLVNAMAAFTPPAPGQTTLPLSHQVALGDLIAASWQ